jgi:hypothetical protein
VQNETTAEYSNAFGVNIFPHSLGRIVTDSKGNMLRAEIAVQKLYWCQMAICTQGPL